MGSVRSTTNDTGAIEDRYEYDAFGKPYKGDFNSGMSLGYTGKPYDVATGLYNYGYRDYKPEVARFTTVDPIRDGNNWFSYVNNDPVNWLDRWGLEATVTYDPKTGKVTINVPITYTGPGATPEVTDKFNKGIEQHWSGTFGGYTVTTTVTSPNGSQTTNTINVPEGDGRATTTGGNSGTWQAERPGWTAAHEAGHLMGISDKYNYETGKAHDGWEGNIMAEHGGKVEEKNIADVLSANGASKTTGNEPNNSSGKGK
jgi:RHS repeat-associated protein